MVARDKCPFCESLKVLTGRVLGREGYGFKPDDSQGGFVLTLRQNYAFAFGPAARYCAGCGMVWSKADAKDAAKFLSRFATDKLKAKLNAGSSDPPPGVQRRTD
jgi:hypothetical protein